MSFYQSRSDKSDTQHRKFGRSSSNQQRGSSGNYVKGSGGDAHTSSPSITSSSSLSSNRSFKKSNSAQGGQSTVNLATVSSTDSNNTPTTRAVQNGSHLQPQLHATSSAAKPTETSAAQRSTRAVPKAPTSAMTPVPVTLTTPAKAPRDASKAFPFQFGSISPSFMNGMEIPARTSSAPPNLDEQKRDQVRHDYLRSVPSPTPPVPKQQPPRKDIGVVDQSNTLESHSVTKAKKDAPVSSSPSLSQMPKPSALPMTGISMSVPYHQSQTSVQFGGPNQQIQSQGMSTASLHMPISMPLPMGNPPQVQHQVFVPGLQPHPMHPQGIMPGQNMSFTAQMGPQMLPQLGNIGIGISPQYAQQQGGNFGGPRKTTVKITHPETHEELRLDKRADRHSDGGSSGPRSHTNAPSQSQPIPHFPASHTINYHPSNSYNPTSVFFPSSSRPLTSSQIAPNSQAPRFNYPANHAQNVAFMNLSSLNSVTVNKTGTPMHSVVDPPNFEHSHDAQSVVSSTPSGTTHVTIKPSGGSSVVGTSLSNSNSLAGIEKNESPKPSMESGEAISSVPQKDSETCSDITLQRSKSGADSSKSLPKHSTAVYTENVTSNPSFTASAALSEESVLVQSNNEGRRNEPVNRSNSIKDHQKKPGKKSQLRHQVDGQSVTVSSLPSRAVDSSFSANTGSSETVETTTDIPTTITIENVSSTAEMALAIDNGVPNAAKPKVDSSEEGYASVASDVSGSGFVIDTLNSHRDDLQESSPPELLKQDSMEMFSESISQKVTERKLTGQDSVQDPAAINNKVPTLKSLHQGIDEPTSGEFERGDDVGMFASDISDSGDFASLGGKDSVACNEAVSASSGTSEHQFASVLNNDLPEATSKHDIDGVGNTGGGLGPKDKPILEPNKAKVSSKGKNKRREILQKADAAGTTSDLYNAYKGPEDRKETVTSSESKENASITGSMKQVPTDYAQTDSIAREKGRQTKVEPDDWEDAADMSTPKLEVADRKQQVSDGSGNLAKKYSRDFLLKFKEQCVDLPEGFEIAADTAEALMNANVNGSHLVERDSYPSPGRIIDRPSGTPQLDRRGSGVVEEERWNKFPGSFGSGRDIRLDTTFGGNQGFRSGHGGNVGVLRNPRAQASLQYGILSGPLQSMGHQGGMQRSSLDAERWQRATHFLQRGLIPSPHTPLQMMHKAEKKYEVGKVTDEEQAKQRQLKAILNKLTPQNFEKLFEQVKAVNIDNAVTLTGVISQIFDKALMEPTFCEMYANFCFHLASELPDFSEDNEKITFQEIAIKQMPRGI
ncbi:Eukaryotic translation initiation factor 4G [Quillaja saponaria]|uniref:Eukaryotic translation initiation factor 4G n=1 Tax=Quillaja saponaria TaxID=32244 RepID=A0AAD7PP88_QUISA|nr:Eukaryotic translation initiation factor 4G [Quillaja saponaria]